MNSRIAVTIVLALLLAAFVTVDAFGASPQEISTHLMDAIRSGDAKAFAKDFTPQMREVIETLLAEA